jgi:hypothetical protein
MAKVKSSVIKEDKKVKLPGAAKVSPQAPPANTPEVATNAAAEIEANENAPEAPPRGNLENVPMSGALKSAVEKQVGS